MPITQLPLPVPSRADPANFAARGDAFLGALPTFVTEANTQATEVNNNASTASAAAGAAVVARDAVVSNAMAAAEAAGAQPWVSGTNYTTGRAVYSSVNYRIYRRVAPGGTTSTDPSADAVNWITASPFSVSADGARVGIGTSAPVTSLHVDRLTDGDGLIVASSFATPSQVVLGVGTVTPGRPFIGTNTSSNPLEIGTRSATPVVFLTDTVERMRIVSDGSVGIGRTPSGATLDVQSSTAGLVRIRGGTAANQGSGYFGTSGSETTRFAIGQRSVIFGGTPDDNTVVYSAGELSFASGTQERMKLDFTGHQINLPGSNVPPTLTVNGQMNITPTSNTNVRISFRGSDGVTRVANIALA